MSERDIFATSSESELLAFYGSLFAIAAADGSVDIDELDLLFKTINLDKFSDSAKTQIQSYTASPPSLSDCLQTLSQSQEPLRLGVMYFLINIAGVNKTLHPAESEAIQSAKKLLAVSDLQIQAMQEFIADTERILLAASSANLQVCILRLGGIYGPGRELVKIFGGWAGSTRPGRGEDATNWVHRDDIVGGLTFALENRLQGIYNLVGDVSLSSGELLDRIFETHNLPKVSWDGSPSVRPYNARVSNQKIKAAGYQFFHPEIREF